MTSHSAGSASVLPMIAGDLDVDVAALELSSSPCPELVAAVLGGTGGDQRLARTERLQGALRHRHVACTLPKSTGSMAANEGAAVALDVR